MTGMAYLEQEKNYTVELAIPMAYRKSFIENGLFSVQGLKAVEPGEGNLVVFSVELSSLSKTLVSSANKGDALKLFDVANGAPFSTISVSKSPEFTLLRGQHGIETSARKFNPSFSDDAVRIAEEYLENMDLAQLTALLAGSKVESKVNAFEPAKSEFIDQFMASDTGTESRKIMSSSQRSDLHLHYDGGRMQDDGKIKLFGLRQPTDKESGRYLYAQYDEFSRVVEVDDKENSGPVIDAKGPELVFVKSEKGGGLPDILSEDTLKEIEGLAQIRPERINLSREIQVEDNHIIYLQPNLGALFTKNPNALIDDAAKTKTEAVLETIEPTAEPIVEPIADTVKKETAEPLDEPVADFIHNFIAEIISELNESSGGVDPYSEDEPVIENNVVIDEVLVEADELSLGKMQDGTIQNETPVEDPKKEGPLTSDAITKKADEKEGSNVVDINSAAKAAYMKDKLEFELTMDKYRKHFGDEYDDHIAQIEAFVQASDQHPQDALLKLYAMAFDEQSHAEYDGDTDTVQKIFDGYSKDKTPETSDIIQMMFSKAKKKELLREFKTYSGSDPQLIIDYATSKIEKRTSDIQEAQITGYIGDKEVNDDQVAKLDAVNKRQIILVENSENFLAQSQKVMDKAGDKSMDKVAGLTM